MNIVFYEHVNTEELDFQTNAEIHLFQISCCDPQKAANTLVNQIKNTSWIYKLDENAKTSYEDVALLTIERLVEIFNEVEGEITTKFGEYLVSMSSGNSLEKQLDHKALPLSELWKERVIGNGGFDFHTVSKNNKIAFGEAKYRRNGRSVNTAAQQAVDFFGSKKDLRDIIHLEKFPDTEDAITNLRHGNKAVALGFSMYSSDYETKLRESLNNEYVRQLSKNYDEVYILGVGE